MFQGPYRLVMAHPGLVAIERRYIDARFYEVVVPSEGQ